MRPYLGGNESYAADLSCAVHKAARLESGYLAAKLRKLSVLGLDLGRESRRTLIELSDVTELHRRRCGLHDALVVFYMLEHAEARNCRYTSDAGGNGGLGHYLEQTELCGIVRMGAAAQLNGEIARADNAHDVAVLLAEQRHCAELLGLFNGHLACLNVDTLEYSLVHLALYCLELIARERRKMGEVKAHFLAVDKLSRLLNMAAEVLSEGCLEQMSRGVVAAGRFALFNIYLSADLIAESDTVSAYEFCDMEYDSVGVLPAAVTSSAAFSVLITPVSPACPPLSP